MNKVIENIIVVGGGTAGCISALMLKKRYPYKNISIIESSKVGIVGVGESSTEHWTSFCKFIGINPLVAITKCNGTFKHGVYFENWAEKDFVDYFPSYEIVTNPRLHSTGFSDNLRSVRNEAVDVVMKHFFASHSVVKSSKNQFLDAINTAKADSDGVECEEAMLEVFGK